jgi:hypothetical protein
MSDSGLKPEEHILHFKGLFTKLISLSIVSGMLGLSIIDFKNDSAFAQVTQELCIPDRGINTSQSNCFANHPIQPVYNMTTTENVRPPPEIGPTYANESN